MMVVDGNSLLHRSYHALAGTGLTRADGHPSWALKGFWNQLLAAVERTNPTELLVTFDATTTFRSSEYPAYKAGRSEKPAELTAQLLAAPQHLRNAGIPVAIVDGYEADDLCASAAATNTANGTTTIIVTSDRDAFSLINEHVSVLRIINGGVHNSPLLTEKRLPALTGVTPGHYQQYAAMRGDSSDNLPGVKGIGEKTAAKLFTSLTAHDLTLTDVLNDLDNGGNLLETFIGAGGARKFRVTESRDNLARNLILMAQVTTCPLPQADDCALPIPVDPLVAELSAWNFASVLDSAVAMLTTISPAEEPVGRAGPVVYDDTFYPHPPQYTNVNVTADVPTVTQTQPSLF